MDSVPYDLLTKYPTHADALREIQRLRAELDEAAEYVEEFVAQDCSMGDSVLDSCAISIYADGLRWLSRRGRVVIDNEYGRRVIARWTDEETRNG